MKIEVVVQNPARFKPIPSSNQLQQWIETTLSLVNYFNDTIKELTIRIVTKKESAQLNETYRGKKGPTNVLSFAYEPLPSMVATSLGDLIICGEIVVAEAEEQQKEIIAHWAHLIVHGTLHLLGYNHEITSEAVEMENFEKNILLHLGYPNPYDNEVVTCNE